MFDLPRLFQLRVELLAVVVAAVSIPAMRFDQVASTVGQHDRDIAVAVQRNSSDKTLLPQVAEIARAWVSRSVVAVEQISRRYDPKSADDAQGARFGTAKRVLVVALVDELTFESAWQVQPLHEDVARLNVALA